MGFSVSGGFAVLVVGSFIAFGMFYGATANSAERVTDAQQSAFEDRLDQQNTAITITTASWNTTHLSVKVNNTGTTTLSVSATDLFVDGDYRAHSEYLTEDVNGDSSTDLWLPGEEYEVVINLETEYITSSPDRVKVVTEQGVSESKVVT